MHVQPEEPMIALIADPARRPDLLELAEAYRSELAHERLVATAATGRLLGRRTGLDVERVLSDDRGGRLQIAASVAAGEVKLVVVLRDPAAPADPDTEALIRICDAHLISVATNATTATLCLLGLTCDAESLPRETQLAA